MTMVYNNVYCNGQTIRTGQNNMLTEQIMTISDYQIIIENTEIILNETTAIDPIQHVSFPNKNNGYAGDTQTYTWNTPDTNCNLEKIAHLRATQTTFKNQTFLIDENKQYFIKIFPNLGKTMGCNLSLIKTDYNNIYITYDPIPNDTRTISAFNLNLFTYIDMKQDFLYHIIQQQITEQSKHDMIIINQALSHAANLNEHKIYQYDDESFFINSGDLIYTFKCTSVEVSPVDTDLHTCTSELAIWTKTGIQYMQPVTHIITPEPTKIPCTSHFAPAYKSTNDKWYKQIPTLTPISSPKERPDNKEINFRSTNGQQYPKEVINEFNNVINFGWTKQSVTNKMVFLTCSIIGDCNYAPTDIQTTYHEILRQAMAKLQDFGSISEFCTYFYTKYSNICLPTMQLFFTIFAIKKVYETISGVRTLRKNGSSIKESLFNTIFSTQHLLDIANTPVETPAKTRDSQIV